MIVRSVLSHFEEPVTRLSADVKTTSHETVLVVVTETAVGPVVFVVDLITGEAAPENMKVSAGRRTVPVQLPPSCSVNDNDPLNGRVEVTVAESLGNHVCAEDVDEVVETVKHSFNPLSLEGR